MDWNGDGMGNVVPVKNVMTTMDVIQNKTGFLQGANE